MKKLTNFIVMAIVCLNLSSVSAQITKEQATNLVLNQVLQDELGHIDLSHKNDFLKTGNIGCC